MFDPAVHSRCVVLMDSESDMAVCDNIRESCAKFGIFAELRVTSAQNDPMTTIDIIQAYEGW